MTAAPTPAHIPAEMSPADIDAWRQRIRADTFSNYHYAMGEALLRTGEAAAAEAALRRAVTIQPDRIEAHALLVEALRRLGRAADAEQADREAEAAFPGYRVHGLCRIAADLFAQGRTAEAEAAARDALAIDAEDGPALLELGRILKATGRTGEADGILRHAVERSGEPAEALYELGEMELDAGRTDKGADLVRRAQALDPLVGLWLLQRARRLRREGDHDRQAVSLLLIADMVPQSGSEVAEECRTLGTHMLGLWRPETARDLFDQALRFQPADVLAKAYLGYALLLLRDVDGALRWSRDAARSAPADETCQWSLGMVSLAAGDYIGAAQALERARAANAESVGFILQLGLCRQALGEAEAALALYREGVDRTPGQPDHLSYVGMALHALGRHEEARGVQERALAARNTSGWIWSNLALLLDDMGLADEAETAYRNAVRYDSAVLLWAGAATRPWARDRLLAAYRRAGWPG